MRITTDRHRPPSLTAHSSRRIPPEKFAFVAFSRRPLRRPTGLAATANRPDFERVFGRTPAALHLTSFLRPNSYSRIVEVLFTLIIEWPKVLNCLQLSLTIAPI
jgi:hypothetical protein